MLSNIDCYGTIVVAARLVFQCHYYTYCCIAMKRQVIPDQMLLDGHIFHWMICETTFTHTVLFTSFTPRFFFECFTAHTAGYIFRNGNEFLFGFRLSFSRGVSYNNVALVVPISLSSDPDSIFWRLFCVCCCRLYILRLWSEGRKKGGRGPP